MYTRQNATLLKITYRRSYFSGHRLLSISVLRPRTEIFSNLKILDLE